MADACFDCLCAFQGIITAQIVPLDWIAPFTEQRLRYSGFATGRHCCGQICVGEANVLGLLQAQLRGNQYTWLRCLNERTEDFLASLTRLRIKVEQSKLPRNMTIDMVSLVSTWENRLYSPNPRSNKRIVAYGPFFPNLLRLSQKEKDSNNEVMITYKNLQQFAKVLQTTDHLHTVNLPISKYAQGPDDIAFCEVILGITIRTCLLKWLRPRQISSMTTCAKMGLLRNMHTYVYVMRGTVCRKDW